MSDEDWRNHPEPPGYDPIPQPDGTERQATEEEREFIEKVLWPSVRKFGDNNSPGIPVWEAVRYLTQPAKFSQEVIDEARLGVDENGEPFLYDVATSYVARPENYGHTLEGLREHGRYDPELGYNDAIDDYEDTA